MHNPHLWLAWVHDATDPHLLAQYHAMLTSSEAAQAARFVFDAHRHRYLLTRALVRTVLSRYHPHLTPSDWRFEVNEYGCPRVAGEQLRGRPLTFNISHTNDLVVLAIREQGAVGVDVEAWDRSANVDVADHFFSSREVAQLGQLPPEQQRQRFMELWTFKESYIKARTMGLALPLNQFGFELNQPGEVQIFFEPELQDHPKRWQLLQLRPTTEHVLALCLERTSPLPLVPTVHRVVPLQSEPVVLPCEITRRSV
jgi:4'-phosphopantetheinyl transferase